ncbi:PilZ domain-containing protein [Brevundimonas sp.]|uniref:PilZ domain-containing protein n=1 Tax=Brevundimonas sp. TaxID=1871086 RepID=UPI0035689E4C
MTKPSDLRFEPRQPSNLRGVVIAPGLEIACQIVDQSSAGLTLRLDRGLALPRDVMIIDVALGVATEVQVAWQKGQDIGLKRGGQGLSLRGLVPSRLTGAREAWRRAGGR